LEEHLLYTQGVTGSSPVPPIRSRVKSALARVTGLDDAEEDRSPAGWRPWACWALVAPFAVWAFGRTLGLEDGFPFVQVMAYTPYALVLSLFALLVVVLLRQWPAFVLGLVAVVALGIAVIPRELGGPDQATGGRSIQVLSFNLLRSRADFGELLALAQVRKADVITLQEFSTDGLAEVERLGIDRLYPHSVHETREEAGGGAIYSRFPLRRVPAPDTGFRQPRALVMAAGSIPFEVMSVHPMAPAGPRTTRTWDREFNKLPPAGEPGPPRVLAGDFNATLDHRNLRDLISTGYRDAGDTIGLGLISTWPSTIRWPLPVTIDHVLVDHRLRRRGHLRLRPPGRPRRAEPAGRLGARARFERGAAGAEPVPAPQPEEHGADQRPRRVDPGDHRDHARQAGERGTDQDRHQGQPQDPGGERGAEHPGERPGDRAVVLEERLRQQDGQDHEQRRHREQLNQGRLPEQGPVHATHDPSPVKRKDPGRKAGVR
jgi:endonuclease/exonuclease/phosphatase (EEP) superfamily protein YafD